ncbi:MAG: zinc-ribbon domain-containing protein [Planctomycetes bacterium]|nr:zinc-ribbon domain-containing protein [Planctomycetota bacterium]
MISFACENCSSAYKLSDEYAGKRVRCKKCDHVILVKAPAAVEGSMPDFHSLFSALAEEERSAPTLHDSMIGA